MDSEYIGKIKLDYSCYNGTDSYSDGDIEEEMLKIAKESSPSDYKKIIEERLSWPVLYHFSELRENIASWLPINKSHKVLEVGSGCGAITGALSKMAGEVVSIDLSKRRCLINAYRHKDVSNLTIKVGNFCDVEKTLTEKFDFICLIGVLEYGMLYIGTEDPFCDFIRILQKHLAPGGRIVIAIENKLGLKYFAGCREDHLATFFSGIEDYPMQKSVRTFSDRGLKDIANQCGYEDKDIHMYYPYPDYKFPHTLFSDRRLPKIGELKDNIRNFDNDRLMLFNEKLAFDMIIREGRFHEFS
nr:class I SAM-dependent methyltransferase [Lachnospiraceae bacterium]